MVIGIAHPAGQLERVGHLPVSLAEDAQGFFVEQRILVEDRPGRVRRGGREGEQQRRRHLRLVRRVDVDRLVVVLVVLVQTADPLQRTVALGGDIEFVAPEILFLDEGEVVVQ